MNQHIGINLPQTGSLDVIVAALKLGGPGRSQEALGGNPRRQWKDSEKCSYETRVIKKTDIQK